MNYDFSEVCVTITTSLIYPLYTCDAVDSLFISAMNMYNRISGKTDYTYKVKEISTVMGMSPKIISMINEIENEEDKDAMIQINTVIFLYSMLETYPNLQEIRFIVSNEKFERITKNEMKDDEEVFNFQIYVTNAVFDAQSFFSKEMIETMNKELIKIGKLSNSYINRSGYIHIKWSELCKIFSIIGTQDIEAKDLEYYSHFIAYLSAFFGEDNPYGTDILYITDYIDY